MREVYADNSATTRLSPVVLEKMMPYLTEQYGNPSSIYRLGGKAKEAVEGARENIAKNLGAAKPNEIYWQRVRQLGDQRRCPLDESQGQEPHHHLKI